MLSRRLFLCLPALCTYSAPARELSLSSLDAAPSPSLSSQTARYRVDATILFLGLPLFSRASVGSGYATVEEFSSALSLQFAAGSLPERARGLNRLGFIQELHSPTGSRYFGFMTSSGEESFTEARRALEEPGAAESPYTAISGLVGGGAARGRVCHFLFPARLSWAHWNQILPAARSAFDQSSASQPETRLPCPPSLCSSFLGALHHAMQSRSPLADLPFAYGARQLTLRAAVSPDRKSGLLRLDGKTLSDKKSLASFRLWFLPGNPIPQRIELQPRSFLRLSLHALPSPT